MISALLISLLGCTSVPKIVKKEQIPVLLNVSEELKYEAFQLAVVRYFRRYNPQQNIDGTYSVVYGKFPVTVSYSEDKIYIESTIPEKHPLWLSNIQKIMKEIVN
jgi:hypothetical protein